MIRKNSNRARRGRWGLTAARRRHWQSASASPARPCGQFRGCPGQPRQILAMAVKAQVKPTPVSCPLPAARKGEPGDRQVPGRVSYPARTRSRASTGTRCAHQRMRDGARPGSEASGRHRARSTANAVMRTHFHPGDAPGRELAGLPRPAEQLLSPAVVPATRRRRSRTRQEHR